MVFSSLQFIFIFLPIFLVCYYLVPGTYRNGILFIGSLIFYGIGEPSFVLLMLFSILINYLLAILIEREDNKSHFHTKKLFLSLSLIYNFGILLFFKYTNFFIENINYILKSNSSISYINVVLPLGISFYTFQIASYVLDVYKGTIKAETNFIDLGAYISMFPQLIAGPIVIFSEIKNELKNRVISMENLENGLYTFIVGLAYKVIIANRIGTLWNSICTIGYESISTPLAWLGALAYSFQLYFDFCGYSLMAVGLGKMLGFTLPKNFNHPYESRSVTEFWRKWHITLGAWFKQYVYIPLGGNRSGKPKTIRNLFIVWFLVGFWHGASWNFIIWGLMIFVFQGIEKLAILKWLNKENLFAKIVSHIYLWFYILLSWTVFAITDLKELSIYYAKLFPFYKVGTVINQLDFAAYIKDYSLLLVFCFIFCTSFPIKFFAKLKERLVGKYIFVTAGIGIFWYAVYFLSMGINNPFLYFRF